MKTMKKFLACSVAALMAASMMTACGDSADDTSSAAETTTTTTVAEEEESAAEEESTADESAEESTADESAAESTADESASDESASDSEAEAAEPKDISEMPATLSDLETASLTFTSDMDPANFVKTMCEADFENDESDVAFSIEEVAGVTMLRCQVLDLNELGTAYKIPKIQFDMTKLFEGQTDVIDDIFTIEIEFVTKAVGMFTDEKTGTESLVPGNFMGALCTQTGEDPDNLDWNELDSNLAESEWTSEWGSYKFTVRPGLLGPFAETDTTQYFTFMRWSIPNQADFYVADITFMDEDGNVLPCSIGGNAKS